ncbi:DMT family transporter [Glycomyces tritici]|uniref:SMR family transporter n=1 Tax=Glycomyces tritici TaxID=2665176 RepID=A0ABT7YTV9_9ACTN|nr:SMR family transporter [Glycomyces tritici]MDN3242077.1 SMR family transporter [Glycomyces tritici]
MRKWTLLALAIAAEVGAALSLRAAIDTPWWSALAVAGYIGAFVALAALLRMGAPIGVVYGIWAASGVALTAVFGTLLFDEPFTLLIGIGIAFVIAGVVMVETGSHSDQAEPAVAEVAR